MGTGKRLEVGREKISEDDLDAPVGEQGVHRRDRPFVDVHHRQRAAPSGEVPRERSLAGTDFQHTIILLRVYRGHDFPRNVVVAQEVLSQRLSRIQTHGGHSPHAMGRRGSGHCGEPPSRRRRSGALCIRRRGGNGQPDCMGSPDVSEKQKI